MNAAYYDRAGRPLSRARWQQLSRQPSYCRVDYGCTRTGSVETIVATYWLGIATADGLGQPRIFHTYAEIRRDGATRPRWQRTWAWATLDQARAGHREITTQLSADTAQPRPTAQPQPTAQPRPIAQPRPTATPFRELPQDVRKNGHPGIRRVLAGWHLGTGPAALSGLDPGTRGGDLAPAARAQEPRSGANEAAAAVLPRFAGGRHGRKGQ